ncbi:unnamed protein product [Linum tenue]|uniref:Uncharacterized protein n=1 Tax=Linum tenue TaxID=586396 RepID=A0AAV0HE21_9ROSI|nr:unnamed protein product [Linum tenue]
MAADVTKDTIHDTIAKKLDVTGHLSATSATANVIKLADLGCSVGPNTLASIHDLIHVIKQKHPSTSQLEFQVFFNDLPSNDFNALFRSLPLPADGGRGYFAAGVPGSFHGRLFPASSLHVVQLYYSIHWLSAAPKGPPANRGRIHYAGASGAVLEAYKAQWGEDMGRFLAARAAEVVAGGMVLVVGPSIPDGMPYSRLANGIMFDCMASILLDLARQGMIKEEEVDAFNLPIYAPLPGDIEAAVTKNGQFTIEAMGLNNPAPWLTEGVHVDMVEFTGHIRAAMEGMFLSHFPSHVVGILFDRLAVMMSELSEEMESAYKDKIQVYFVLCRK